MLLTDNLYKHLLVNPQAENSSLLIVSGYATAAMASYHLEDLQKRNAENIKIFLIVGMTPRDGISENDHKGFVSLMEAFPHKFSCSYIDENPSVHSKLYVWCENKTPRIAFAGSANYTQTALLKGQGEIATQCSPELGFKYFNSFDSRTIYCNHPEAEDFVDIFKNKNPQLSQSSLEMERGGLPSVKVPFLRTKNQKKFLPEKSGLNWGQRPKREPNQAYIPIKSGIYKFFPPRGIHFTVLTDDGKILTCSRLQDDGKAIQTPLNNSLMGEYFRNRLGIPNGKLVTKEHLEQYGRTDVEFYKIDEENYYMDFSQNS